MTNPAGSVDLLRKKKASLPGGEGTFREILLHHNHSSLQLWGDIAESVTRSTGTSHWEVSIVPRLHATQGPKGLCLYHFYLLFLQIYGKTMASPPLK